MQSVGGAPKRAARGGPHFHVPPLRQLAPRALCRGYSNSNLLAALGAFALITFLLQVQSGDINPLAWFARPPAAAAAKGKGKAGGAKSGKPPPMIVFPVDPMPGAAERYVAQRKLDVAEAESIKRDVWLSVKHMDSLAAAQMLAAMEQTAALEVLSNLEQRDLARIFEASDPAQAATWAAALLNQPPLPPVPDPFKARAKAAGLYDDTQELLQQYATGAAGAAGAPGTAPPAPGTDAAPGAAGATGATDPGAGAGTGAAAATGAGAAPGVLPGSYARPPSNASSAGAGPASTKQSTAPPRGGKRARAPARAQRKRRTPPPEALDA
jgi:hypothetical protein